MSYRDRTWSFNKSERLLRALVSFYSSASRENPNRQQGEIHEISPERSIHRRDSHAQALASSLSKLYRKEKYSMMEM